MLAAQLSSLGVPSLPSLFVSSGIGSILSLPTIRVYLSIPRPTLRVEFDVELGTDCMVLNSTSAAAEALKLHLVAYMVLGMSCFFRCIISSAPALALCIWTSNC